MGAERLHKWFDAIETHGLAEWNSCAYYPINYRALLALYTLTKDVALKRAGQGARWMRSRRMVALHMCGGVAAGSQGRIYEKELLAGPMTELGAVGKPDVWRLARAGQRCGGGDAGACRTYRPEVGLGALTARPRARPLRAQYRQGLDGQARLALYKTAHVQLVDCHEHHAPHQKGHQQHVLDLQLPATRWRAFG